MRAAQGRIFGFGILFDIRAAQISAKIEKVVLDARQGRVRFILRVQPGDAHETVEFVDRPIGFDARIVLCHAVAIAERGIALVAGAGVDLVQDNHQPVPFMK